MEALEKSSREDKLHADRSAPRQRAVVVAEDARNLDRDGQPLTVLAPAHFILRVSRQAAFTTLPPSRKKSCYRQRSLRRQQAFQPRQCCAFFHLEETPDLNLDCRCSSRPSMHSVEKIAEKHETFDDGQHLSKQTLKLCALCSLYLGLCMFYFGISISIAAIAIHRSIVVQQNCANLAP